uniref:Uncharacterized protein n=1 Tax=Paramoeba aestuarina TaxID=180227 RepID=A0A7S4PDF1_9EUKA|mmetsp:Transcript_40117/g.63452  ORF Transcript_40117/g.63452 Transcript_40117/m.63452 type:complete len:162 (+) Transcript_40117:129-614(+)
MAFRRNNPNRMPPESDSTYPNLRIVFYDPKTLKKSGERHQQRNEYLLRRAANNPSGAYPHFLATSPLPLATSPPPHPTPPACKTGPAKEKGAKKRKVTINVKMENSKRPEKKEPEIEKQEKTQTRTRSDSLEDLTAVCSTDSESFLMDDQTIFSSEELKYP